MSGYVSILCRRQSMRQSRGVQGGHCQCQAVVGQVEDSDVD